MPIRLTESLNLNYFFAMMAILHLQGTLRVNFVAAYTVYLSLQSIFFNEIFIIPCCYN